jgi:hypothetical protein
MINFDILLPVINVVLAAAIAVYFVRLFFLPKRLIYMPPWELIFTAFVLYVIEEVLTITRSTGLISYPLVIHRIIELCIIVLFLQALWLHKSYVDENISLTK